MKYRLLYTRRAVKDIQSLDEKIKQQIGKTLLRYSEDPLKHAKKLLDPRLGSYRFRVGDYRVIYPPSLITPILAVDNTAEACYT